MSAVTTTSSPGPSGEHERVNDSPEGARPLAEGIGVEVRCVAWQPLKVEVLRMAGDELEHFIAVMRVEAVPHDGERTAHLASEVAQGLDDVSGVEATLLVACVEARWRAPVRGHQSDDAGNLAPFVPAAQQRRVPHHGPGGSYSGPKRTTHLVHEGNGPPVRSSPLLMRGQSRLSHASTSSSLRCSARVRGC